MQHLALFALFGATLALAGSPAFAAGTVSLDKVRHAESRSLDSADVGHTDSLDSADDGRTDSLDSADDGKMVDDFTVPDDPTSSLDADDRGRTHSLDSSEDGEGWQVPACDELSLEIPPPLPASDSAAWRARLSAARRELTDSKARLEAADAAYSSAIIRDDPAGQARAEIIEGRDEARTAYGNARCQLPALVESARRAGVEPGVFRAYE